MHTVVNARKADQRRERQHEFNTVAKINKRNHRGGEPVRRVGRWHAAGIGFANAGGHVHIRKS